MATDKINKPTGKFTEIYQFISAPIIATLHAEMMAAKASADFIERVGFKKSVSEEDDTYGELRHITFFYKKPGTTQKIEVQIPLISLIPIPLLQVKKAEFEFGLSLLRSGSSKKEKSKSRKQSVDQDINLPSGSDNFSAAISTETSESKNMKMKVLVEQSDLPIGLTHLFQLMDSSINESGVATIDIKPNSSTLDFGSSGDTTLTLDLLLRDKSGKAVNGIAINPKNVWIKAGEKSFQAPSLLYQDSKKKSTDEEGRITIILNLNKDELGGKNQDLPNLVSVNVKVDIEGKTISSTIDLKTISN